MMGCSIFYNSVCSEGFIVFCSDVLHWPPLWLMVVVMEVVVMVVLARAVVTSDGDGDGYLI